ncbi:MAG: MATE family efflux transporter [Alphaproteobacteria bacterium]
MKPSTKAARPAPPGLRRVIDLAVPIVISNVTVPLIGLVDTAVMGRMPDAAYIGAVALGAVVFSFVYWGFGFLRMGTTGLTAQAFGRWHVAPSAAVGTELRAAFARPLAMAFAVALALVVLQWPVGAAAFAILNGSEQVEALAETYFYVRIWGAPFTLGSYAVLGWLLGVQATRAAMATQIVTNLANVALSLLFVLGFGWGVAGVAAASVLAEAGGLAFGVVLVRRRLRQATGDPGLRVERTVLLDRSALKRLAGVNFDIFVRTLVLVFALAWLTDRSAQLGDRLLAANAILLQFQAFLAFALDAFAFAAEALVGQAIGARDRAMLVTSIRLTWLLGLAVAAAFAVAYAAFAGPLVAIMTDLPEVREITLEYRWWMAGIPLAAVSSYLLDGVFIGATRTREMRNAMLVSVALFVGLGYLLAGWYGNHGLWTAYTLFMLIRTASLLIYLPRLMRDAGPA